MRILFLLFCIAFATGTNAQDARILELKHQTIKIGQNTYLQFKGKLEVPEDPDHPEGKTIELPFIITKTRNRQPEPPVFFMDGGPGSTNLMHPAFQTLLEKQDFVSVGYRGVDSDPVFTSAKMGRALRGYQQSLLSDQALDKLGTAMQDLIHRIQARGIEVQHYTMVEVIRDMELARKAFGYDKINLLSVSYGTRVAWLYSQLYPNAIHRSVLVGANPPGHFKWFPEITEGILMQYDQFYQAQFHVAPDESLVPAMKKAFEKMPKRWSGFKMSPDKIKTVSFLLLYSKTTAPIIFDAYLRAAKKGDYSGLYLMQLAYDYLVAKKSAWGDSILKGFTADFDPDENYRTLYNNDSTVLGPNLSLQLWGMASGFPVELSIPENCKKVDTNYTETLIISGDLDVSTPAIFAEKEFLPFMPNGKHLVMSHFSHEDIFSSKILENKNLIALYYTTGQVPTSTIATEPVDFKPKFRLYRLAKWWYPVVVFASLLK